MKYLNVYTSNVFTIILTIDTATSGSIQTVRIGDRAGATSTINTIPIITITIATIKDTTGATTIINTFTSNTGAGVLKFRIIRIRAAGATLK